MNDTIEAAHEEAIEIAKLTRLYALAEERLPGREKVEIGRLLIAKRRMVLSEVVASYTMLDEMLGHVIAAYYLAAADEPWESARAKWSLKLKSFAEYVLDEMYLLKKMKCVQSFADLKKETTKTLPKINDLRNALAHSRSPHLRREYAKSGGVIRFNGEDIFTVAGAKQFQEAVGSAAVDIGTVYRRVLRDVREQGGTRPVTSRQPSAE